MDKPKGVLIPVWVGYVAVALLALSWASWTAKPKLASVNAGANISLSGMVPIYDSAGNPINNARCMYQSILSDNSGQWTVNYANMGFSMVSLSYAQAMNPTSSTSIAGQYTASMNPPGLTSSTGTVVMNVPITILTISVPILQLAATSTRVSVIVCGS